MVCAFVEEYTVKLIGDNMDSETTRPMIYYVLMVHKEEFAIRMKTGPYISLLDAKRRAKEMHHRCSYGWEFRVVDRDGTLYETIGMEDNISVSWKIYGF